MIKNPLKPKENEPEEKGQTKMLKKRSPQQGNFYTWGRKWGGGSQKSGDKIKLRKKKLERHLLGFISQGSKKMERKGR